MRHFLARERLQSLALIGYSMGGNLVLKLAGELGPLPPMKIHCAQLVEGALRSALEPQSTETKIEKSSTPSSGSNLLDSFSKPKEGMKLTFLDEEK